eukprot:3573182-Rhodomonas_salina.1
MCVLPCTNKVSAFGIRASAYALRLAQACEARSPRVCEIRARAKRCIAAVLTERLGCRIRACDAKLTERGVCVQPPPSHFIGTKLLDSPSGPADMPMDRQ